MSTLPRKLMRGEIYYIKAFPTCGSEQRSGRPAVIVSNNENNAHSGVVEICYLTLKDKNPLPTHVFIDCGPCINSTVLCEQVTSVALDKIGDFMCRIPEHLESELDKALAVSLALTTERAKIAISTSEVNAYQATPQSVMDELTALKHNAKIMSEELFVAKDANATLKKNLVEAESKAKMYERMYDDLLDRLVKKAV